MPTLLTGGYVLTHFSFTQGINYLTKEHRGFLSRKLTGLKQNVIHFFIYHSLKQIRLGENKPCIKCHDVGSSSVCSGCKWNFWLFSLCINRNISSSLITVCSACSIINQEPHLLVTWACKFKQTGLFGTVTLYHVYQSTKIRIKSHLLQQNINTYSFTGSCNYS